MRRDAIIYVALIAAGCSGDLLDFRGRQASKSARFALTDGPETKPFASADFGPRLLSARQITNKVAACLGSGLTVIRAESVISLDSGADADAATEAFLLPEEQLVGSEVALRYLENFDGPEWLKAAGTRTTTLSLAYLTALETVANVVGHNCALFNKERPSGSSVVCDCYSDLDAATAMLQRCLPFAESSTEFEAAASDLFTKCQSNHATAIASLVGSLTFVTAP